MSVDERGFNQRLMSTGVIRGITIGGEINLPMKGKKYGIKPHLDRLALLNHVG